jgi:nucleoside-diphosphate-sugar epimerase
VLRPPLVYGPAVKANFLALMRAIARGMPLPLAGIENRRSLIYVGNLCDAILACLGSADKTYLVSDGAPVSTPQLCRAIGAALGRPARLFPVPWLPGKALTASLEVDDRAIRAELGWKPPFSFEEGLRLAAAWYRNR